MICPLVLVIPETVPLLIPLQWPETVAPETGLPEESTMVIVADARVKPEKRLRAIPMLLTCILPVAIGLMVSVTGTVRGVLVAPEAVMVMVAL